MSEHLHLQHKFTNRGGREVYEIYDADDNKRMQHPLGTITMPHAKDDVIEGKGNAAVMWLSGKTEDQLEEEDCKPVQLELDV